MNDPNKPTNPSVKVETSVTTGEAPQMEAPKYSKRLKGVQKSEKRLTSASRRMAKAVLSGIDTWDRNRDKSASEKKDGAVRKALDNYTRAYAKVVRQSSVVPRDLIRGVLELYPKNVRKYWGF